MTDSRGGDKPTESGRDGVDGAGRRTELARGVSAYLLIPTIMGVSPVLGFLLGSWFEKRYGHAPWLSFAGVVFGAAAGVRQIIRILRTYKSPGGDERSRNDGP